MAVVAATATALVVWGVADPALGVDLLVDTGTGSPAQVGPGSVIASSVVASLAGWALLAALERLVARSAQVWTAIAAAAAVLSLFGPVAAGLTMATTVALGAMHVAVAAVLIPLFRRTVTPRGGAGILSPSQT
jgi:hypothetical protein